MATNELGSASSACGPATASAVARPPLRSLACIAITTLGLAGCQGSSSPPHIAGPGPSTLVTTRVAAPGEVVGPSHVDCTGPVDAVVALGAICAPGTQNVLGWTDDVGDMSFVVGSMDDAGPKLLVLGYFDPSVPGYGNAADIRYAAYFLPSSRAIGGEGLYWYLAATLAQWGDSTPIAGDVVTDVAEALACQVGLRARATLLVGTVTVTITAELDIGC